MIDEADTTCAHVPGSKDLTMAPTVDTTPLLPSSSSAAPSTFVVPLDGSDYSLRAVPVASWYATRFDADVVAVTSPTGLALDERAPTPVWLAELVADERYPRLRACVAADRDPVDAVASLVAANRDPVVCMATHARGTVGTAVLGNVAEHVVREIGVPVLLVGRHCAETPRDEGPIVVCHDGSSAANAILGPARAWARGLDLPIVLVHVYHPLDTVTAADPAGAIRPALEFLGPNTRAEVIASSFAAGAIRDLAHEHDATMIALSTHGQRGLARVVMGSVASWVTRESPCPVLAVRPDRLEH
jgi:nucleotide-binding universal stress UspA family protein